MSSYNDCPHTEDAENQATVQCVRLYASVVLKVWRAPGEVGFSAHWIPEVAVL